MINGEEEKYEIKITLVLCIYEQAIVAKYSRSVCNLYLVFLLMLRIGEVRTK